MIRIWNIWKRVAEAIGNLQFKILFSFFYFILVTPIGVLASFFIDPINKKGKSRWTGIRDNTSTKERMKRQ